MFSFNKIKVPDFGNMLKSSFCNLLYKFTILYYYANYYKVIYFAKAKSASFYFNFFVLKNKVKAMQ